MADPHGTASFPGFVAQRGTFTLSLGVEPSVGILYALPGQNIQAGVSTFFIEFGNVRLTFPGAAIDSVYLQIKDNSYRWAARVKDRRWRWSQFKISGKYNVRRGDGTVDPNTEKTPRELAAILLNSMGEAGYNVALLPDAPRPYVNWDESSSAQELKKLCDSLSSVVSLGLDNRVTLYPLGFGNPLPNNGFQINPAFGLKNTSLAPNLVKLICGPTLFQSKLKMRAVGIDTDGSIKLIDDLSYKPTAGWGGEHPLFFSGVAAASRHLAFMSVYRWYEVYGNEIGGLDIPGFGTVKKITQLFPLKQQRSDTAEDTQEVHQPLPPLIEGDYYAGGLTADSTDDQAYPGEYLIYTDADHAIVKFAHPMYKISSGSLAEADLYLTTSYNVKDDSGRFYRLFFSRLVGGPGGTEIQEREELVHVVRPGFNNQTTIADAANKYLDALVAKYAQAATQDVKYAGVVPISTSGLVRQVRWDLGDRTATTRASVNAEFDIYAR